MTQRRYTCACCGHITLEDSPGSFDICKVCFWEDDPVQLLDPWYGGGANGPSLVEAQENFRLHGASEQRFLPHVRKPSPEETLDPTWRSVVEADRARVTTPAELGRRLPEGNWPWYYWVARHDA
jgi:hypothetical protein